MHPVWQVKSLRYFYLIICMHVTLYVYMSCCMYACHIICTHAILYVYMSFLPPRHLLTHSLPLLSLRFIASCSLFYRKGNWVSQVRCSLHASADHVCCQKLGSFKLATSCVSLVPCRPRNTPKGWAFVEHLLEMNELVVLCLCLF